MNEEVFSTVNHEDLIESLEQKLGKLNDFCNLTSLQRKAILDENINELNSLIQKKEHIIKTVDEIDNGLSKLVSLIGEELLSNQVKYLDLKKQIHDQLKQALELDEQVRDGMERLAQKMVKSMKDLRLGRQTIKSYYQKSAQVEGYFIDQKK
ncbi:hypothetical protein SAMN05660649_00196 [Desulfotomaculum arcticum]|uniref:FlgN protein n=1 Tax=Desulfotruncus arcticus DSM 17038 TaxID=1121424 RepID=A0A1I2MW72_9FIRM|nr:hypothetical protein [Desulfotruncus arcticus]SFF95722.1 hypothetical protein SAMN05660649_00196 [Desulfotomaculum arcticum] [Desulfotruncus arcticus DSM 17038]